MGAKGSSNRPETKVDRKNFAIAVDAWLKKNQRLQDHIINNVDFGLISIFADKKVIMDAILEGKEKKFTTAPKVTFKILSDVANFCNLNIQDYIISPEIPPQTDKGVG